MTLADVKTGEYGVIVRITGHGSFRHRLMEMGFVRGEKVKVIRNAPLRDPIEYEIMGGHVSLRRIEARRVEVVPVTEEVANNYLFHGTVTEDTERILGKAGKQINVALVGNPNCGKTSFFNHATGMREKVGNYSGVTVDSKVGYFKYKDYTIALADLPGTYSLTEYTPEELYVRQYIMEQHPDIVLNIADASNLERNLFLTTQLIDMNVPMVMALNMYDELEKNGDKLDIATLSELFGFPIVPTVSSRGTGIEEVMARIVDVYENLEEHTKHVHINYGVDLERAIDIIKEDMRVHLDLSGAYSTRYLAIEMLAGDKVITELVGKFDDDGSVAKVAAEQRAVIEKRYNEDAATIVSGAKYGFVRGALLETFEQGKDRSKQPAYSVDKILTNRWLGFPILIFFLWFMFQMTFTLGAYPQAWLESFFGWLGEVTTRVLPDGIVKDLLVDGIIAGVGGVCSFLPNILILFFFISVLEDTGYMARAAFIMDKLMHRMGLHGKSFIPYIIGFGCSVPAIMATRTLENRKDRILTIITVPFMSCSARLPVYLLLISAFFTKHQGLILTSIYLLGIVMAVVTSLIVKKAAFKHERDQFVMELPPYRIPTFRNAVIHMWDKSVQYLKKMGTVILVATVIIWALEYFPQHSPAIDAYTAQIEQVEADGTLDEGVKAERVAQLELDRSACQIENSYIGRFGKFVAPVFRPLGFDWQMGVSLITGFAAKEIVVSSMGVLYHSDAEADENSSALQKSLQTHTWSSGPDIGKPVFTPWVAFGYMVFILLYFPCVAALTAVKRESNGKWMLFTAVYTTTVAWLAAFLVRLISMAV
ncbi:MAG: ferrous iron transport protein B [Bacteroidales bacterium]|nr:ferrous iron transport protein B [Bacteroidales bacterium]MBQ2514439.1 ferrous iron transport protein B [Bacteroidales bacterium]MBR4637363.1 ferrous iron transport protein B [Bacteroidales bacterium]MBR5920015.1 ferrous iron transport protein B [Bacteroidales bacterium]MBR6904035.1 ferrous iron transport protein B [Bacteroidales bacterium]